MELKQGDIIKAKFCPLDSVDLKDEAKEFIGNICYWRVAWVIEHGDYEGDWAMTVYTYGKQDTDPSPLPDPKFLWAPLCDIEVVKNE